MSILGLQILIIVGFIVGFIVKGFELNNTQPTIVSKSLWNYFLGR